MVIDNADKPWHLHNKDDHRTQEFDPMHLLLVFLLVSSPNMITEKSKRMKRGDRWTVVAAGLSDIVAAVVVSV